MLLKGCSSIAQLQQISIFQDLAIAQLESLIPFSYIREYQSDEIVMREGDRLPLQLFAHLYFSSFISIFCNTARISHS